jgi:hypothetical protein
MTIMVATFMVMLADSDVGYGLVGGDHTVQTSDCQRGLNTRASYVWCAVEMSWTMFS